MNIYLFVDIVIEDKVSVFNMWVFWLVILIVSFYDKFCRFKFFFRVYVVKCLGFWFIFYIFFYCGRVGCILNIFLINLVISGSVLNEVFFRRIIMEDRVLLILLYLIFVVKSLVRKF